MLLPKFITAGIHNHVPPVTQAALWELYEGMCVPEKDYLQIFELKTIFYQNGFIHHIRHRQEVPEYVNVHHIPAYTMLFGKLYIIRNTSNITMLWSYEY